ncbi:MAG: hypothetical protein ACYS26_01435 [Planctomycetota bacterium]
MHDALERLDGVQDIFFHLQANMVLIEVADDRTVVLDEIPRSIYRAGFDPAQLRVIADGAVERGLQGARFTIDGWPRPLALDPTWELELGAQRLEAQVVYADGQLLLVEPPPLPDEGIDLRRASAIGQEIVN